MPQTFSFGLSLSETPSEAHARVRESVTAQVFKSADMSPCLEGPVPLAFRPKLGWPLLAVATRRIRGENINLEFRPAATGTTVAVTGKVAGHDEVASREFWTKTLTAA
jgi:hypothetical protein